MNFDTSFLEVVFQTCQPLNREQCEITVSLNAQRVGKGIVKWYHDKACIFSSSSNITREVERKCIPLLNGINHTTRLGIFFHVNDPLRKVCERAPLVCECVICRQSVCHTTIEIVRLDRSGLRDTETLIYTTNIPEACTAYFTLQGSCLKQSNPSIRKAISTKVHQRSTLQHVGA